MTLKQEIMLIVKCKSINDESAKQSVDEIFKLMQKHMLFVLTDSNYEIGHTDYEGCIELSKLIIKISNRKKINLLPLRDKIVKDFCAKGKKFVFTQEDITLLDKICGVGSGLVGDFCDSQPILK